MISVDEALRIILAETSLLGVEEVALADAPGRVLAEEIVADTDLPPFDRAQMDGYAVRAADTRESPARLRIVGESAAGRAWPGAEIQQGEAVRIMTGAPVPAGADAVQRVEVTRETAGATVEIQQSVAAGQSIVRRAAEVTRGTVVLRPGATISAQSVAVLASFGYAKVRVARRPRVAIIATGSELVAASETPGPSQIRDSNTHTLAAYARHAGAEVERAPLAGDDTQLLGKEIDAAARRSDMLILSGGVSMGVYDFTKSALWELGAEIFFERVAIKPGKPTVFARLGDRLVFGLPGNPVSVAVTFNLFARAALRAMQGAGDVSLATDTAVLAHPVRGAAERASYLPALVRVDARARLVAETLRWGGSSDFVAFAGATALVVVPQGVDALDAEAVVQVIRLP